MSDARWQELADTDAIGEPLSPEDRAYLRDHGDADELALFGEIGALADEEPVRADDRGRAEATLQRFRGATQGRRSRVAPFAFVGAIAAALLVWFAWPRAQEFDVRVSSGGFVLAGDALAPGARVPAGEWIAAEQGACLELDGARACFDPGSELRVVDAGIELRGGSMRVESGAVIVRGDEGPTTLHAGDRREVLPPPAATVALREPAAAARSSANAEVDTTSATSASVPTPAAAPVPAATPRKPSTHAVVPTDPPSKMLADARALANAGDLSRAVAAYDALRRAHPDSADAHAANVSMGELQLRRGRAKEALAAFERYLRRSGGLAEEARWGRVRALDRLGRTGARDRAIDELLAKHPGTVYAADARALKR